MPVKQTFVVEGMMCDGCVRTVTVALKRLPGVLSVNISLRDKQATVKSETEISAETFETAVTNAGYRFGGLV